MRKFKKNIDDRKVLVRRLEELTGEAPRYTYVPRCAYEIGAFTVEKDGNLTVGDDTNEGIIEKLKEEGLIGAEMAAPSEESESPSGSDTEAPVGDGESSEPEPLKPAVSFPLSKHTAVSLVNLICMVYSRGLLLSKATGGEFHADREFVDGVLGRGFTRVSDLVEFVRQCGDGDEADGRRLAGISFTDDKVTFDGFPAAADAETIQTFMRLAAAMNKMALTQKRVQAKEVDDNNEKYALRIWLVRLGMSGDEYKADRRILMANLSGNTAFRNEEERERWTARQTAKRDELRAAKAAHTTPAGTETAPAD